VEATKVDQVDQVAEEINKLVYHKVVTLEEILVAELVVVQVVTLEEILVVDQVEIQEEEVVAEQM
jgi:hypothetical protein